MARYRKKLDKFDWHDIDADTDAVSGKRIYNTPDGPAFSVTTILATLPNPALDEWRERVGEEEASRISKEATDIGSLMHDALEAHLLGQEFVPNPEYNPDEYLNTSTRMANVIKRMGWRLLNEVWAVEIPLHCGGLYAGRTDLVGLYNGVPAIMDYKTARYIKPPDHLEKYRLQLAAYALAMEHMFGMKFEHAINFFAIRPNDEFKKSAESHIVEMGPGEMHEYKIKWIEVLLGYYEDDASMLAQIGDLIQLVES